MVGPGDHKKWMSIVENQGKWKLKHGWYVTRHSNTEELAENLSTKVARERESLHLDKEPWKSMPNRDKFGTVNLVMALSELLSSMIREWCLQYLCF